MRWTLVVKACTDAAPASSSASSSDADEMQMQSLLQSLLHDVAPAQGESAEGAPAASTPAASVGADGGLGASAAAMLPLPSASTCNRTLYLPAYPTEALLREKVLAAVILGSMGFGHL
jgi:hypothetical protein